MRLLDPDSLVDAVHSVVSRDYIRTAGYITSDGCSYLTSTGEDSGYITGSGARVAENGYILSTGARHGYIMPNG